MSAVFFGPDFVTGTNSVLFFFFEKFLVFDIICNFLCFIECDEQFCYIMRLSASGKTLSQALIA